MQRKGLMVIYYAISNRKQLATSGYVATFSPRRRDAPMSEKYKRDKLQRNKSFEYGPVTEKEPRFSQAPGKVYPHSA